MSAYKKLNKQDAFITPYTAHKKYTFSRPHFEDSGIDFFTAVSGSDTKIVTSQYTPSLSYKVYITNSGSYSDINDWINQLLVSPGALDPGELWVLQNAADQYPGLNPNIDGDGKPTDIFIHKRDQNNVSIENIVNDWTDLIYKVKDLNSPTLSDIDVSITSITAYADAYHLTLDSTNTVVNQPISSNSTPSPVQLTPSTYTLTSKVSTLFSPKADPTTGNISTQYKRLTYDSIKHLYYSTQNAPIPSSGSFINYDQTTLLNSGSRELPVTASVISIPRSIIGNAIRPGSLVMSEFGQNYVSSSYVSQSFIIGIGDGLNATDDREGNLIHTDVTGSTRKIGDVIYPHGMVILTDEHFVNRLTDDINYRVYTLSLENDVDIFTHQYRCRVKESDLNHTFNPSAVTGSLGIKASNVTGSCFQPYISTVGLYNDAHELVAVGKLGQPIPKSQTTDMTFVINLDI